MLIEKIKNYNIILASNSPRRKFLLKEAGFEFIVNVPEDIDEGFPANLIKEEIPIYLSEKKSNSYKDELAEKDILITADTIVWVDNQVVNKPIDKVEAIEMIKLVSGKTHQVYSGVTIRTLNKTKSFSSVTDVKFKNLSDKEIEYYIETYKPYDKAGAYGIQEWIGYIGIEYINGSYFNVMGLPIQKLYVELENLINT